MLLRYIFIDPDVFEVIQAKAYVDQDSEKYSWKQYADWISDDNSPTTMLFWTKESRTTRYNCTVDNMVNLYLDWYGHAWAYIILYAYIILCTN